MNKLTRLSVALALALPGYCAMALDSQLVYGPQGQPVFELRFFDVGDGPMMDDDPAPLQSSWNLDAPQKDKIKNALSYWAEIIKPSPGQLPAIINVGTVDDENAFGTSTGVPDGQSSQTQLQRALLGLENHTLTYGSHGQFVMGKMDWDDLAYVPSQLPRSPNVDLASVAFHELAHGLGIMGSVQDKDSEGTPYFGNELSTWDQHIKDDNGNAARPGQAVVCSDCNNNYAPDSFDVRQDKAYFAGEHVAEVMEGALPGVPVRMHGDDDELDSNYMSHTELKNSMMSHQNYRNYTTFMEAELALMQDLGYDIDRRNFYGYSVYGDGRQLVNNHGFSLRNSQGDAYVPGYYNTATLGLGMHLYGSNNTVFQQADLLTQGAGGAGVRVDGQGNTVAIEPGTRVYADGLNARGVMFTYGKQHKLIQRGDVQALGEGGIAASFDFGNNLMGNTTDYRGSYIHTVNNQPAPLLDELNGALVERFDLTGRLAGQAAAIYISSNALVNNINIMRGAQIQGDIYSGYKQLDDDGKPRLTRLTFGQLPDGQGQSTGQADAYFAFRHDGDIRGDNLDVTVSGGYTSLNGEQVLYGLQIAPGATLAGNSSYTVNPAGSFMNNGTLSPGNSLGRIEIAGDYRQGAGGTLLMEVDGKGAHDTLAISGNADLNGRLSIAPQRDWYAPNWSMRYADMLQAGSTTGAFSAIDSQIPSPTLAFHATPLAGNDYQLAVARQADAYSQYAQNNNAHQVGRALDSLVANARDDMQPLYRTLDFSSPDGSRVAGALDQLSPAAYSALFASSLNREQQIAQIVGARGLPTEQRQPGDTEWRGFAVPFGSGSWQNQRGSAVAYDASGYGVVFGAEKQLAQHPGWVLGAHGAVSEQSVSIKTPNDASGKTTAFNLGLQARYARDLMAGPYLFGHGRIGVENGKMDRRIRVDDYSATNKTDWTGLSAAVAAGGGYRWALSKTLSVGPVASLSYTRLSRPGVTESGSGASRLDLPSSHVNSLRSSIGISASLNVPRQDDSVLQANLQLTWDRELMDNDIVQNASFAGYQSVSFNSRNDITSRDSLGVQAGLTYEVDKSLALGANLSSQLFRSDYHSVAGNLSVRKRF